MAHAGKDTGGSQFFICHSPQPHLDGVHTVFGHTANMDVVNSIEQGDEIISVEIVPGDWENLTKKKSRAKYPFESMVDVAQLVEPLVVVQVVVGSSPIVHPIIVE